MSIHPTAIVSPKAVIGENVEIGPYSIIEDDVVIGDNCVIDAHVKIGQYTTLGPRCTIYFGTFIGEPQDHRFYKGITSYTEIGSDTVIREYVTIHRPPFEGLKTIIGSHVLLQAFVHVAHDCVLGDRVTISNHTTLSGHVQVETGAVLSGFIKIHQFCRIGALAMIGPECMFGQDVPPFCMLWDNSVNGPNVIGLRRAGFSGQKRLMIRRAIKTFFFDGLNATSALTKIQADPEMMAEPEVGHFCEFIKESKRGIIPGNPKFAGLSEDQRDALTAKL